MMSPQDNAAATSRSPGSAAAHPNEQASGWQRAWWRQYFPAALALLLGVGISAVVFRAVRTAEWRHMRTDFIRTAGERASVIATAIDHNCLLLTSF
jgi:hypothetical protein